LRSGIAPCREQWKSPTREPLIKENAAFAAILNSGINGATRVFRNGAHLLAVRPRKGKRNLGSLLPMAINPA
jgi:hypothetical protein